MNNIYEFYSYATVLFSCPFFHLFSYRSAASRRNTVTLELGYSNLLLQAVLSAIAEIVSMRFVNGIGQRTGLMGIDYPTARWLYKYVTQFSLPTSDGNNLFLPVFSIYMMLLHN